LNIKINTKPNWLLLILSVLLFIMVFLPWWSYGATYFGIHVGGSANGFHNGGILTFLMSLVGVALSFLEIPTPRYKTYAIFGVGILALVGVLIAFKDLGNGVGMGAGMILALIISILIIVLGYLDYRGVDIWAKIKASTSSAQPPPPPSSTPPTPPPAPPTPPPPSPPPSSPPAPPAQQ
jgi:hypothetical protein